MLAVRGEHADLRASSTSHARRSHCSAAVCLSVCLRLFRLGVRHLQCARQHRGHQVLSVDNTRGHTDIAMR